MPNPYGAPSSAEAEDPLVVLLQAASTANGNGAYANVEGYDGQMVVEITETGGGTATVNLEGSMDQNTWYALGYQQKDNVASPARAVAAIAVAASSAHVYQLLDYYKWIRARQSSSAGGVAINATLRALPV